ncbi:hypothetical protein RRG08_003045 [Elysia crispata]|uniref:Uncharacterized protein n=1 Tax=Elysia crispata TaxID=231223 RepID=A0AAE1EC82_9GAST|nr:hypothetical protein RRG08_003045 [Elysia crispata]
MILPDSVKTRECVVLPACHHHNGSGDRENNERESIIMNVKASHAKPPLFSVSRSETYYVGIITVLGERETAVTSLALFTPEGDSQLTCLPTSFVNSPRFGAKGNDLSAN